MLDMRVEAEQTGTEVKQLRACINDLMGVVALPAIWSGSTPSEIVRTLLDALLGTLRLDFVYLRLKDSIGEPPIEAVRAANRHAETIVSQQIAQLLRDWPGDRVQELPKMIRNVPGGEEFSIIPLSLGLAGEIGILVAGSQRADFPSQTERLLLTVAANQTSVWLQGARLLSEQKRVARELDQRVAQRTEELAAANNELRMEIAKQQSMFLENARLYQDLQDRERRIRRLIDSNIIGIVIWDLDGRLIDANDAFLRMVRYEREDLQAGLRWFDMTPPEWQEAHARYEAEELKITGMMQAREKEYFRKDGSRVPVLIGAACFEDQPNQGVAYIVDLSEQKRAEEALRRSEQRWRAVFENSAIGVALTDMRGQYLATNFAYQKMLGYSEEELKELTFLEITFEEDRKTNWVLLGELIDGRRTQFQIEKRYRRKDGRLIWVSNNVSLLPGTESLPRFVMALSEDITGRKEAEEESERLRRVQADLARMARVSAMGELTASLAHEIRQPLTAALANAETCLDWLQRERPNVEEGCEAALEVVRDVSRAAGMISSVSALFRKGTIRRESIEVNGLIQEMVSLLRNEALRNSVIIRTELAEDVPRVNGDRMQLQQVLMNLLLNGIDAMKNVSEKGELIIKSEAADEQLLISVIDAGVGLPPDHEDRIFKPFFTTKEEGTGVGLSISRSIIESHGGRLWAAPNSDQGATFRFTLPVTSYDAHA